MLSQGKCSWCTCGIVVWPMVRWCKKADAWCRCWGLEVPGLVKRVGEAGQDALLPRSRLTSRDGEVENDMEIGTRKCLGWLRSLAFFSEQSEN